LHLKKHLNTLLILIEDMKKRFLLYLFLMIFVFPKIDAQECVDILVVGGGASGVAAGIQSARMGTKTLILEETEWLGGMLTSAGVSAIDGNYNLPAGIWGEFKDALAVYYGGLDSLKTGWVSNVLFEPSVGNKILHQLTAKEKRLKVWMQSTVKSAIRKDGFWKVYVNRGQSTKLVQAKIIIDATELGDIAKLCGVKYDVGMESRKETNESVAPETSNDIIQDITYVAILKDYGKDVTIPCPKDYDPKEFACCCVNQLCTHSLEPNNRWSKEKLISYGKLPNNKYMINWPMEGNDFYVNLIEMSLGQRQEALKLAKKHTMNFIYFIQHELGYKTLGLADDEYPTADKLPFIPYHRESRRIHGLVRFTLNDVTDPYTQPQSLYRTNIAVGDYPVDHHHNHYNGQEKLPNLHFHPVPSFGLPLGTLIPKNVEGLIVAEKSISVSNIINGTTRLQPVVMQIGQAAGALASIAISKNVKIKDADVRNVQNAILNAKGYLLPYLDVDVNHPSFKSFQRIGSTGILKGVGKSIGWSNQTWLRADTVLLSSELKGLKEVYPMFDYKMKENEPITLQEAIDILGEIVMETGLELSKKDLFDKAAEIWENFGYGKFDLQKNILRGEMAVLIDQLLDPFDNVKVDMAGQFIQ